MKTETLEIKPETIEFDDNNLEHVLAGPDYGQPWGDWNGLEKLNDYWINEECEFGDEIPVFA